ncbi:unnamed protein product [Spirodela intermedia]|uniref:PNPLA domain-containing protein n=1 Tax=Spirodela intermedia TaxID=51605 RepID=A0A7I8JUG8_SPIIN|nr:unnamed protein product [Spirodela intermedia]CAA2634857.1 unnamed protein product [Spirodela intermedia]CAA6668549.1 unnamed protein product [Spirodela intermedia]CAA6673830.1 unnamed protein product [Spirodela intermedia]
MSAPAEIALKEPTFNMDKLSYEIFSILESKFLFGYDEPNLQLHAALPQTVSAASSSTGRIRILSVDAAGATDGLLAAASLAQLESSLENLSGVAAARIADFFDVAAGSGVGGVLVALLFTRGHGGRPLLSAAEALEFIARNRRALQRIFGESTLRDTLKPVLIPCYDLSTGAPFLFSRADAIETVGYDFLIREVCAATVDAARMRSVDGKTAIDAVDGGVAVGNPAAAAITHVLNNRMEFPFVTSVEDLLVLSLGNGESVPVCGGRRKKKRSPASASEILRIAGDGASDMVDQAASMAFGQNKTSNYVRIQASVFDSRRFRAGSGGAELQAATEELLAQKSVESVLFRGRRVSESSNAEKLEWVAAELVKEHEGRKRCPIPVVVLKQGSPRSSSCSLSSSCSHSPIPAPRHPGSPPSS